ncbi:SGNH/GDSL hydrolase family protein [Chitinophaga sp. ARDCPP14]|uniref:SGNH/GDSL hydrolase family protein n=1 Tax=Chitinophaga sp. ARDCPP14 TaxID=3391139 RepID=UPI003F525C3C
MSIRLTGVVLLFLLSLSLHAQTDSLNAMQEYRLRQGLPNFFAKLKSGGPLTIAYFGGSITAASGGWRDQSVKWFQQQYPQAQIKQINAGVGGTGSDLGVFRLRRDVLSQQPDLVFVEFAVNDGGPYVHQTMEGIVRQIWKVNPSTDICFVYTMSGNMLPVLQQGQLWPTMLAMEHIAQHYGIPSVQLGMQALALLKEGKLVFQGKPDQYPDKLVFSGDNVHPNTTTGHRLYTEALVRAMQQLRTNDHPLKHTLIAPYTKDNWEDAQLVAVKDLPRTGQWSDLSNSNDTVAVQFRQRFPLLVKSTYPGSSLQINFNGRLAGLYDLVGPGCGEYEVTIDGQAAKPYPRFDRHAVYYRTHYFFLPLLEAGPHTINLEVSGKKLDKMSILKTGDNQPGDLEKYNENACYAGWLLLLGSITNQQQ